MISEALVLKLVVVLFLGALGVSTAWAQTVTLQQGADGYAGCTTRTIEGTSPAREQAEGVFPLRGTKYALHVRFELPGEVARKTLARARLMVFLPAARKPNAFTEIFCHEVVTGGRQPAWDEVTDYDNGRRAGAVDSVELFSPTPGQGWNTYPWLPLGVPEGGRWIEFNITPLVEKWRSGQDGNHGVILIPTPRPDGAEPSTWEIDVPAADSPDQAHRPKLVLEMGADEKLRVGTTHSLVRIHDSSTRFAYRGGYDAEYELSMARDEREAFQVVLYPMLADLANVKLTCSDLAGPDKAKIGAGDVEVFVVDHYKLRRNWLTSSKMFGGKLYDTPDPLIPAAAKPVTARRHRHTPFYVRVRTAPDTPAGTYTGAVTVAADGVKPVKVALSVKVWPYAIPRTWNFHTMGQYIEDNCARFHGSDWNDKLRREYYDFLLDHRFAPTQQYRQVLSPTADMQYCLDRGMNTIYLYSVHGQRDKPDSALINRIRPDYEKIRDMGALDYGLVYIGDETNQWDVMRGYSNMVHAHLPGAQVMIGGSFPREELTGYIDIYDPQIGGTSKTYSLQQEAAGTIATSQGRGEEFYWYVAAGPAYPYPNVQVEYPVVDNRVLFWMTWKYGVSGFEYYCYNIWERNYARDPAQRYPNVPWQADGWAKGWPSNGDGMLFYPGPISSLRFEAIRDGIEDWESLQVLADCVEAVRQRKHPDKYKALIAEARELLAVRADVVKGFQEFTRDPDRLLAERQKLGELLARFVPAVEDTEKWDAGAMKLHRAAEVRIARVTARRRQMLRQRHLAACEALKVKPLDQAAWDALWPKRVLFAQDFEGPSLPEKDWEGVIETANTPSGSKQALAGAAGNKYFAQAIRVGCYFDNARAATTTWVRFKYFLNKPVPLQLFVFSMTGADNWVVTIDKPVAGKWTELTLNVTDDFRKKSGGPAKITAGHALDDVFFHAGKPGDSELKLIVDDVELIGLD